MTARMTSLPSLHRFVPIAFSQRTRGPGACWPDQLRSPTGHFGAFIFLIALVKKTSVRRNGFHLPRRPETTAKTEGYADFSAEVWLHR
jgi:hypothetical protein